MVPSFFGSPAAFRRWLERHHASATELWVGFYKKGSGRRGVTYAESVDEALCFGWIDGVRKSVDADRYVNRFTPRRPGSVWSVINARRARALIAQGRMHPAGLAAFKARDPKRSVYSFAQRKTAALTGQETAAFRANTAAWRFFASQPPGYRRLVTWWVISAKRPETRARRLQTLIVDSAAGRRIGPMQRPNARRT